MTFWHWAVLGLLLLTAEILVSGFVLIWLAVAAALVALAVWIDPALSWQWQWALFALLSVATLGLWLFVSKGSKEQPSDRPNLNRRGQQYVGQRFVLAEPIVNGTGKVRVGDTLWRAQGEDAPGGAVVEVVGVEGASLLVVEVLENSADEVGESA